MRIEVPIKNRISAQWVHVLWLFLFVICFSLQASGLEPVLQFDRALIDQGQIWLLLTGHLVHLNWTHWALNMAGLAIVAVFFSQYGSLLDWLFVLLFSAVVTGLGQAIPCVLLDETVVRFFGCPMRCVSVETKVRVAIEGLWIVLRPSRNLGLVDEHFIVFDP